jgi:hypothetical protein
MPRFSLRLPLLAAALSAAAGLATAQQSSTQQSPPELQRIEPGSDQPHTNIPVAPGKDGTQIKETRGANGMVTQAEVVTPGGSHYYMQPNVQPGNAQGNTAIRAPQWKVGEFDLTGKRKATSESGVNTPTSADVPPPPPMPATADEGTK